MMRGEVFSGLVRYGRTGLICRSADPECEMSQVAIVLSGLVGIYIFCPIIHVS